MLAMLAYYVMKYFWMPLEMTLLITLIYKQFHSLKFERLQEYVTVRNYFNHKYFFFQNEC